MIGWQEYNTDLAVAIEVILKKETKFNQVVECDNDGVNNLRKYIKKCAVREENVNRIINKFVVTQEPIFVWGVGTHTQRQLIKGELGRCNIKCFIDSNKHYEGAMYNSIDVLSPKDIPKEKYKILISSCASQNEILKYVKQSLKLENDLITLYEF